MLLPVAEAILNVKFKLSKRSLNNASQFLTWYNGLTPLARCGTTLHLFGICGASGVDIT